MSIYAVAQTLRLLRSSLHLSQEEAAQRAGVSRSVVSTWEEGSLLPKEEALATYSRIGALRVQLAQRENVIPAEDYRLLSQQLQDSEIYITRQLGLLDQIEVVINRYSVAPAEPVPTVEPVESVPTVKPTREKGDRMESVNRGIEQTLLLLRQKIKDQGFTQRRIQKSLGWGRSYVSQLLGAQKALRLDQLLNILHEIDVEPGDFFEELYQSRGTS